VDKREREREEEERERTDGVRHMASVLAMMSRLLKNIGLFGRI